MQVGIDASNIRSGGGVTHLREILKAAEPQRDGITKVSVWSNTRTLSQLEERPWLCKFHQPVFERSLLERAAWQQFHLKAELQGAGCDILFVPGGTYGGAFRPYVAMSQNLLPFEWHEAQRYGLSVLTGKFLLLRKSQSATFRKARGLIFLTEYARQVVTRIVRKTTSHVMVIPHGIDQRFRLQPRDQRPLAAYTFANPFKVLYVSTIAPYKHQWLVMEAVRQLREAGLPVQLELIGGMSAGQRRFATTLERVDPTHMWVQWRGELPFDELHKAYHEADMFLFASSCENLPNILLEAMASGLPIVSSDHGPMPEVLADAGVYFDPEVVDSIATALRVLLASPALRHKLANMAFERASRYSWKLCADQTFAFIAQASRD